MACVRVFVEVSCITPPGEWVNRHVHPSEGTVVNYTLLTSDYREHLKFPQQREGWSANQQEGRHQDPGLLNLADILTLDIPARWTVGNECLLFKPLSL